jgi:predicted nucleic acid-binding protein
MSRVFVDTGAFFALLVADDRNHERAKDLFERAVRDRWRLVTTNAVVTETHALLLVRARDARYSTSAMTGVLRRSAASMPRPR